MNLDWLKSEISKRDSSERKVCKIPNISEQHLCGYNNAKASINLSKMKIKCTGKLERFEGWKRRWIEENERRRNPILHSEKAKPKNLQV